MINDRLMLPGSVQKKNCTTKSIKAPNDIFDLIGLDFFLVRGNLTFLNYGLWPGGPLPQRHGSIFFIQIAVAIMC